MPGVSTQHRLALVWLTVLAVLMLVLSACAAPGDREPEFDATTEPSRKPTAVPEERPTPEPTAVSEEKPTPEPTAEPEECWDGVLSAEPLHCYILQQAQEQGLLAVDAIYEIDGRDDTSYLRIYLKGERGWISDETGAFLREKTAEFLLRWPRKAPKGDEYEKCRGHFSHEYCLLDVPIWSGKPTMFLPWPVGYTSLSLKLGGAEARLTEGGWASWRQLWPKAPGGGIDVAPRDGFDVSDVDLTNIPEVDCEKIGRSVVQDSCYAWERHPGLGIAGWHGGEIGSPVYIQLKSPSGDEAGLEALKRELVPDYGDGRRKVVIIPVKYDFEELWRWAEILDRFSLSAGNTIGIRSADVSWSSRPGPHGILLGDLVPPLDSPDRRETIRVGAQVPQRVADALPTLLPLLGIPVDAVGQVSLSISAAGPALLLRD